MLREGFTTPDNVQKKDLFFYHVTRSECIKMKLFADWLILNQLSKDTFSILNKNGFFHHSITPTTGITQ